MKMNVARRIYQDKQTATLFIPGKTYELLNGDGCICILASLMKHDTVSPSVFFSMENPRHFEAEHSFAHCSALDTSARRVVPVITLDE